MHTILHNIQKVLALIGKNAFIEHIRISTSGNLTATANHIDGCFNSKSRDFAYIIYIWYKTNHTIVASAYFNLNVIYL